MNLPKFILAVMLLCVYPGGMASEIIRFSENGDWGLIEAQAYSVSIRKAGSLLININNTMELEASFIQRCEHYQFFHDVKYVRANLKEDKNDNSIILEFNYFWNDGKVYETLTFTSRSIAASYVYTPFIDKDTRAFSCGIDLKKPKKQPDKLELIGLDRSIDANGALIKIGKWRAMQKPNLRMLSVRNSGKYVVDFLAEGNAWMSILKWPHLIIYDNGEYPNWSKSFYKAGEPKTLKYMIEISAENGKSLKDAKVSFKSLLPPNI
ncbi:MAG: hypothetical protein A2020_09510 [Lentisphaerae bacterium GWF2_45_14]|nr:MAG: hypothetical protein A2020_09510 [Lentisphaerae bacterium GWF2_45_14]